LFGHLPDRIGGAKVASACMLVEAAGLAIIWRAPGFSTALAGVTLTGLGYSLVFPGLGVEAIHLTPPQSRGVTMGTYTAFLDLALGIASPALGLIAATAGLRSVFLVSSVITVCTAALGLFVLYSRSPVRKFVGS
jgi:MFS family permease